MCGLLFLLLMETNFGTWFFSKFFPIFFLGWPTSGAFWMVLKILVREIPNLVYNVFFPHWSLSHGGYHVRLFLESLAKLSSMLLYKSMVANYMNIWIKSYFNWLPMWQVEIKVQGFACIGKY
jgi:hypothetical protein